jgi:hypothetical protein
MTPGSYHTSIVVPAIVPYFVGWLWIVGTGGKTKDEGNEGEKRKVSSNMY